MALFECDLCLVIELKSDDMNCQCLSVVMRAGTLKQAIQCSMKAAAAAAVSEVILVIGMASDHLVN